MWEKKIQLQLPWGESRNQLLKPDSPPPVPFSSIFNMSTTWPVRMANGYMGPSGSELLVSPAPWGWPTGTWGWRNPQPAAWQLRLLHLPPHQTPGCPRSDNDYSQSCFQSLKSMKWKKFKESLNIKVEFIIQIELNWSRDSLGPSWDLSGVSPLSMY